MNERSQETPQDSPETQEFATLHGEVEGQTTAKGSFEPDEDGLLHLPDGRVLRPRVSSRERGPDVYSSVLHYRGHFYVLLELDKTGRDRYRDEERRLLREGQQLGREAQEQQRRKALNSETVSQRVYGFTDQQLGLLEGVLRQTLLAWSLPFPLNDEEISALDATPKAQLAQLILGRSTLGVGEVKELQKN